MRFIIFLTYSSYIEAYEVQKINNKVLRQGVNITIVGFSKLRKQHSQLLRLCQQQRPVTKAGHTNLKIKRKKNEKKGKPRLWVLSMEKKRRGVGGNNSGLC